MSTTSFSRASAVVASLGAVNLTTWRCKSLKIGCSCQRSAHTPSLVMDKSNLAMPGVVVDGSAEAVSALQAITKWTKTYHAL